MDREIDILLREITFKIVHLLKESSDDELSQLQEELRASLPLLQKRLEGGSRIQQILLCLAIFSVLYSYKYSEEIYTVQSRNRQCERSAKAANVHRLSIQSVHKKLSKSDLRYSPEVRNFLENCADATYTPSKENLSFIFGASLGIFYDYSSLWAAIFSFIYFNYQRLKDFVSESFLTRTRTLASGKSIRDISAGFIHVSKIMGGIRGLTGGMKLHEIDTNIRRILECLTFIIMLGLVIAPGHIYKGHEINSVISDVFQGTTSAVGHYTQKYLSSIAEEALSRIPTDVHKAYADAYSYIVISTENAAGNANELLNPSKTVLDTGEPFNILDVISGFHKGFTFTKLIQSSFGLASNAPKLSSDQVYSIFFKLAALVLVCIHKIMQILALVDKAVNVRQALFFFFVTAYKYFVVLPFVKIVDLEVLVIFAIIQLFKYLRSLKSVKSAPVEVMIQNFRQPDVDEMMKAIREANEILRMSPENASEKLQKLM